MKLNKMFIILLISILALFVFNTNTFASWDAEYEGVTYTIPDIPSDLADSHYIIVLTSWNGKEYFSILYTQDSDYVLTKTSAGFEILNSDGTNCSCYLMDANMTNLTWGSPKEWYCLQKNNNKTFVTASDNVYNTDGTIFFQIPPLTYQVPEITEVAQIPEIIVGALQVIIPGSLIVLLVVFLIYLIKSVILRMV